MNFFISHMTPQRTTQQLTLRYYARKALKYKWLLILFFFSITIAVIGQEFVTTLLYKQIFDLMAENQSEPSSVLPKLLHFVLLIAITHMTTTFFWWRVAGFTNDHFQPFVMRDIED